MYYGRTLNPGTNPLCPLEANELAREARRTQSIAVGGEAFVTRIGHAVNPEISKRKIVAMDDSFLVRWPTVAYTGHSDGRMEPLSSEKACYGN